MTVSIAVGTRFPAYATSMGRVLLAGLEPAKLDAALTGIELQPFTDTTVHDIEELRHALAVVREQGFAVVDQELEHGLRSAAAPVCDDAGTVIAAVNVSVHATRASVHEIEQGIVPPLLDAAARISADFSSLGPRASD